MPSNHVDVQAHIGLLRSLSTTILLLCSTATAIGRLQYELSSIFLEDTLQFRVLCDHFSSHRMPLTVGIGAVFVRIQWVWPPFMAGLCPLGSLRTLVA